MPISDPHLPFKGTGVFHLCRSSKGTGVIHQHRCCFVRTAGTSAPEALAEYADTGFSEPQAAGGACELEAIPTSDWESPGIVVPPCPRKSLTLSGVGDHQALSKYDREASMAATTA